MKSSDYFHIGSRLTSIFALLIVLILAGNGVVIWQFHVARVQTNRLIGANQQLIAVLQLQVGLLSFHQRLDDAAKSGDARSLTTEADLLRRSFEEQAQQTRVAVAHLLPGTSTDPALVPTLETIETAMPAQLEAISELAKSRDWTAVQRRLDNELKPIETQTSELVGRIQQQANQQLAEAVSQMGSMQRRVILIVPTTAILTFFIAAFWGLAITQRIVELRLEERVSERTRIARELHDSLLQSLHGLMFEFQAARNLFKRRPEEALQALDGALMGAERAIIESQDAIENLRGANPSEDNLEQLIRAAGDELLASQCSERDLPTFVVVAGGRQRVLVPLIQDEVYRIVREVLRNAFRHAAASRIDVEILYSEEQLRLRLRDDGRGIDPQVLREGRRPGHWGLPGIRERASQIGAKLDVRSQEGAGTEVQLAVDASIAYQKPAMRPRLRVQRRGWQL